MDAFVRKLAALSILWSLCELLLPEGGQRRLVRMTLSALVMITLLSSLSGLLTGEADMVPALDALSYAEPDSEAYAATALRSLANQVEGAVERFAARAGYDASAAVYLRRDGALEYVELALSSRDGMAPLISRREVAERLSEMLETDVGNIRFTDGAIAE